MEVLGFLFIAVLIGFNAVSFFGASSDQDRVYEKTASDTKFNKLA